MERDARRSPACGAGRFGAAALALLLAFGCSGGTTYKKYEAGDEVRAWKLGGVDVGIEVAETSAERQTGLITKPTAVALAAALDQLWGDRDLAAKYGRAGRDHYRQLGLSWREVVRQLLQ